jgi:hypothetical protein
MYENNFMFKFIDYVDGPLKPHIILTHNSNFAHQHPVKHKFTKFVHHVQKKYE